MRINADTIKYFEDLLSSYKAELEHLKSYKAEWDSSDKDRYNNLLREANNTSQFINDFKDKEWPPLVHYKKRYILGRCVPVK